MVEGLRVAIMPTRGTDLIFIQAGFVGIRWRHFIGRADMPRELFTLEEVAERFHVSRRRLQDFVRDHRYYRTLGRRKLFTCRKRGR